MCLVKQFASYYLPSTSRIILLHLMRYYYSFWFIVNMLCVCVLLLNTFSCCRVMIKDNENTMHTGHVRRRKGSNEVNSQWNLLWYLWNIFQTYILNYLFSIYHIAIHEKIISYCFVERKRDSLCLYIHVWFIILSKGFWNVEKWQMTGLSFWISLKPQ